MSHFLRPVNTMMMSVVRRSMDRCGKSIARSYPTGLYHSFIDLGGPIVGMPDQSSYNPGSGDNVHTEFSKPTTAKCANRSGDILSFVVTRSAINPSSSKRLLFQCFSLPLSHQINQEHSVPQSPSPRTEEITLRTRIRIPHNINTTICNTQRIEPNSLAILHCPSSPINITWPHGRIIRSQ